MPKKPRLTPEQRYANKRACQENYRHRVRRFTLQFSLQDTEALEWFEQQPDKGKFLKELMLADKEKHANQINEDDNRDNIERLEESEMAVNFNELLYEKMQAEYSTFIEGLKQLPPEEIIERSYEKVIKEELVACCADSNRSQVEAKALYRLKKPLDEMYQQWLSNDYSYMDLLHDTIDDRAKSAVKEMRDKRRDSR